MKDFFTFKTWLLVGLIVVLSISISAIVVFYSLIPINDFSLVIPEVMAGSSDNVSGFAWSSNYGWISFNAANCDADGNGLSDGSPAGCPAAGESVPDYGVNIDNDGIFSGYAWSANSGWINFAPAGPYPSAPQNSTQYDNVSGEVTGWAKVEALGNGGWLKMYNISIDSGSGYFSGYAWNGNDDDTGLGWVSMSGSGYQVIHNPGVGTPVITGIVETTGLGCTSLRISWSYSGDVPEGLRVYRSIASGFTPGPGNLVADNLLPGTVSYADSGLSPGNTYYYRVSAFQGITESFSDEGSGTTAYVCDSDGVVGDGECPNLVHLSWVETVGVIDYYIVERCNVDLSGNDCLVGSGDWAEVGVGGCYHPTSNSCDDEVAEGEESNKFRYRVTGYNDSQGEAGDWSDPSDDITPCPDLPGWQEIKPR